MMQIILYQINSFGNNITEMMVDMTYLKNSIESN